MSNRIDAAVPLDDPFHPAITPSSVQNMKLDGFPAATVNAPVFDENELKITPLTGPMFPAPPAFGIVTTSAVIAPVPS